MSGYSMVLKVKRIEEHANKLGFMFAYPKYRNQDVDQIAIQPKDNDALPIYARDAQVFYGTLDEVESFLQGLDWARNYDYMLRVSDEKKRERKEQDLRNKKLVKMLLGEKDPEVQT